MRRIHRRAPPRRGSNPLRSAVLAFTALVPAAFAAGEPDLKAASINAPNIAEDGSDININIAIENLGGALPAETPITFDVYITSDYVIDANDPHCGQFVTTTLGVQNITIHVPEDTPAAYYTWAMRVTPAAGELNESNNVVFGIPVGILHVDMCLLQGSPTLEITTFATGPSPQPVPYKIGNCGEFQSILIYNAIETPEVPWLAVSPATNFAVAQADPATTAFMFDTGSLPLGDHTTTVNFVSITNPNESIAVDVTVHVVEPYFSPGDRLLGEVAMPGEVDEVRFHGIPGELLRLQIATPTGDVKPIIELLDNRGMLLKTYKFKHSVKAKKKNVKIPSAGLFRLRISGAPGTFGAYDIKTTRKLPKMANKAKKTLKSKDGSGTASQPVLCLPGATLSLVAAKGKKFTGPLTLAVTNPLGANVDTAPFSISGPDGSITLSNLTVNQNGQYLVLVTGFASKSETVKLLLNPVQPPLGNQLLFIP
jgi:hypothetical protein